jgi:hypothetical protein
VIKYNEAIYDEQIAPLMAQIIAICQEHQIPMVVTFEYEPEGYCTTALPFEGQGERMAQLNKDHTTGINPNPLMLTTRDADGNIKDVTVIL